LTYEVLQKPVVNPDTQAARELEEEEKRRE